MQQNTGNGMKFRMLIIVGFMTVMLLGVLVFRLYTIQIKDGKMYQQRATAQQLRTTAISANRGSIYDRNGKELARSATVFTIFISPAEIKDDAELALIAENLSQILEVDKQKILDAGQKKDRYYEIIKTKVEKEQTDLVLKFASDNKIKGINIEEDTKRYYQYGDLAAQLIGFTGSENKGAYGLESYYESVLSGTPGRVVSAKNGWSTDMSFRYNEMYEAKDGNSIVLTIDEVIQHYVERNLEIAVKEHTVKNRAAAIVMDVNTGAILAMATEPDFDPNQPLEIHDTNTIALLEAMNKESDEYKEALRQAQFDQWRNKAISDPYEPGSVFKIVTAAAALEINAVNLNTSFFCPGFHIVSGVRIGCWKNGGHGDQNLTQAVENSCNPAFMMIGARIGGDSFFDFFNKFGLSGTTGIDLPGEADNTQLTQSYENLTKPGGVELASSSFGQTFKITALQLITAISAAVNGGNLYEPYVVKQIVDNEGNIVENFDPQLRRKVVSEETSATMRYLTEQVVANGSGRKAQIPGYRIGGKTGTSEKLDLLHSTGRDESILSFVGFAPADNPQIAVLVMLDEPALNNEYGSTIAAPVVGAIISEILPYLGLEPTYTDEQLSQTTSDVPNVIGFIPHDAQSSITARSLKTRIVGEGTKVVRQIPAPGQTIPKGGTVIVYTDEADNDDSVIVPDVRGFTPSQANKAIVNAGLNISIYDKDTANLSQKALTQAPAPGQEVPPGTIITVYFSPVVDTKTPAKPPATSEDETDEE